ncbi:MAG: N-acetylglucosamine-6-phosphate deacetylase, partial [Erysipelotrichaceae bacterium]|nr:N-acetylglucosamine-6-phosphate deacetylase [Erysipelotrichaceae bacterium]
LLKHGHLVVDGNREFIDGSLLIDDDVISEVFPQSNKIHDIDGEYKEIDLKGQLVMPGFFDTHNHGIDMMGFDDADRQQLDKMSYEYAMDGTTSYLGTLSYDLPYEEYDSRFSLFEDYEGEYARFQGIHMEGPFLNRKHLGIGTPERFLSPDIEMIKDVLNKTSRLKQMTIAYELDGAKQIGQLLHEHGVKVMCGHSDAVLDDLDENVEGFTHLFNAMRGLHHRDITLINCAFMNRWNVEVIADGHHIDRNVLKLVLNNIDKDRIMLVSDSSTAKNLPDGEYEFLSRKCTKKGTVFMTHDGHYAGSVVSINDEMKVLYELGAKYTDLLLYSGYNAYRFYGLDKRFGTLEKGKYADLVIMDDDLNIKNVMLKGKFLYA